jgi:succinate dehydrogenase/fumarate reductase cytochrome b subunit
MRSLLGLIVLVLDILAIVKIVDSKVETDRKILWTAIIVLLPVLGLIVWYLFGRTQKP